jgi:hypothetical protein
VFWLVYIDFYLTFPLKRLLCLLQKHCEPIVSEVRFILRKEATTSLKLAKAFDAIDDPTLLVTQPTRDPFCKHHSLLTQLMTQPCL